MKGLCIDIWGEVEGSVAITRQIVVICCTICAAAASNPLLEVVRAESRMSLMIGLG